MGMTIDERELNTILKLKLEKIFENKYKYIYDRKKFYGLIYDSSYVSTSAK